MTTEPHDPMAHIVARPLRGVEELPEICRLYDLAGWGPISAKTLESWLFQGPHGPALTMVLVDEWIDRIMGMMVYTPHKVQIFDSQEIASRARSAILDPRLRRSATGRRVVTDEDPLILILDASRPLRLERGWRINFALPNPLFLRRNDGRVRTDQRVGSRAEFGRGLRIDLGQEMSAPSTIVAVPRGTPADPAYDDLWQAARQNLGFSCGVVRDAQAIGPVRGRLRLELRHPRTGALRGYTKFTATEEGRLEDILAVDGEAMDELVAGTVAWLNENRDKHSMNYFNAFPHPACADSLRRAGAFETDYIFSFIVRCLDDQHGPWCEATNWYVTMGD